MSMHSTDREVDVRTRSDGDADGDARPATTHRTFTEAKSGFKTSEFFVMLAFVAGVLIATYVDSDSLSRSDGWRYAAIAVAAYVVSRGLAKLGVREPYTDRDGR